MSRHYIDESPLATIEARPYCHKHSGNTIVNGAAVRYWDDCDCEHAQLTGLVATYPPNQTEPSESAQSVDRSEDKA